MQAGAGLAAAAGWGQSGAVTRLTGAQGCQSFGQAGAATLVRLADGRGVSPLPAPRTGFLTSRSSPMRFLSSCFPHGADEGGVMPHSLRTACVWWDGRLVPGQPAAGGTSAAPQRLCSC